MLPLWLGSAMAQRDLCELQNPHYLTKQYKDILQAGSEVVNFRTQSASIYENILKLCIHLSDEDVVSFIGQFQTSFIERFSKIIIDMADSAAVQQVQNEGFTNDLKRLSNLEREIFEQHRRSRVMFTQFKGRT